MCRLKYKSHKRAARNALESGIKTHDWYISMKTFTHSFPYNCPKISIFHSYANTHIKSNHTQNTNALLIPLFIHTFWPADRQLKAKKKQKKKKKKKTTEKQTFIFFSPSSLTHHIFLWGLSAKFKSDLDFRVSPCSSGACAFSLALHWWWPTNCAILVQEVEKKQPQTPLKMKPPVKEAKKKKKNTHTTIRNGKETKRKKHFLNKELYLFTNLYIYFFFSWTIKEILKYIPCDLYICAWIHPTINYIHSFGLKMFPSMGKVLRFSRLLLLFIFFFFFRFYIFNTRPAL